MPTQANKARRKGIDQSRTEYSSPSFLLFCDPQQHTMAPANIQSSPRRISQTYFEEYGLSVPLLIRGQKRPYARSVQDLASKSKEGLEVIVKAYAEKDGPKIIKALISKIALAEWIERVETLAFGPHPQSKLPSTTKEDIVEALGLKVSALKSTGSKADRAAPRRKPSQKKTASPFHEKADVRSTAPGSTEYAGMQAPQKRNHIEPTIESPKVTEGANKRKKDNAATLAVEQTPAKKAKVETGSLDISVSLQIRTAMTPEAKAAGTHIRVTEPAPEPVTPDREVSTDTTKAIQPPITHEDAEEQVEPEPELEEEAESHVASNGGRYHASKIDEAVHFTFIPDTYDGDACPKRPSTPDPFLKRGNHGRHGDFTHDWDLLTGRGHQVDPLDLKLKRAYEARYHAFHTTWPFWPFVDQERRYLGSNDVEGKAELDKAEMWMMGYRNKYPGELVGHLWPCGCEIPRDEDESDEDESEEE